MRTTLSFNLAATLGCWAAVGSMMSSSACGHDERADPPAAQNPALLFGLMLHIEPQMWKPCDRGCVDCGEDPFLQAARAMDGLASVYEAHGARISMQVGLGYAQSSAMWPDVPGSVQDMERRGHEISVHIHYPAGSPGGFRAMACPQSWPEDKLCEPNAPAQLSCDHSVPAMTQAQYCSALSKRISAVNELVTAPATGLCAALGASPLNTFDCLNSLGIDYVSGLVTHSPLLFESNPACPTAAVGHASLTSLSSYRPVMGSYGDALYSEGLLDEDRSSPLVAIGSSHVTGMMNPNQGVSGDAIVRNLEKAVGLADARKVSSSYMATHLYEFGQTDALQDERLAKWDELLDKVDELVKQGKVRYASLGDMHRAYLDWESSSNRLVYPQNANFEADDQALSNCNAVDQTVDVFELFLGWMAQDGTSLFGDSGRDETVAHVGQASLKLGGAQDSITALPGLAASKLPIYDRPAGASRVRASAWVRTEPGVRTDLQVWSYASNDHSQADPPASRQATGATVASQDGEWQQLVLEAEVSEQAPFVRVALRRDGSGAAWFDDVLLETVP